jgi:hypothetical protein
VRIAALASVVCLVAACAPAEMASTLVVSKVNRQEALVKNTGDLAPGDVVHMWRYTCRASRCGYGQTGDGVVTVVLLDSPNYALVQLRPDTRVAPGDHASKDVYPMPNWRDEP